MSSDSTSHCIFCRIIAGEAPAHKVYEDDRCLVILDIHPFAPGHCLVLSKAHVPWWHDLTEEDAAHIFRVARMVARKLMKALKPDFVGMHARGRRIPHTHIFLVPTFPDDLLDRFFKALERAQESPPRLVEIAQGQALAEMAERIRNAE